MHTHTHSLSLSHRLGSKRRKGRRGKFTRRLISLLEAPADSVAKRCGRVVGVKQRVHERNNNLLELWYGFGGLNNCFLWKNQYPVLFTI